MYNFEDDACLIRRFLKGDEASFNTLVSRHMEQAYSFAFRLTRDQEVASDVVALAFTRVYKSVERFEGKSTFTTWLYRIITNCFLDIKKKETRRQAVSIDTPNEVDGKGQVHALQIESNVPSAFSTVMSNERTKLIWDAIAQLPETQRTILVMFHAENLDYQQICDVLNVPMGTVKSRLNRARLMVQEALRGQSSYFVEAA